MEQKANSNESRPTTRLGEILEQIHDHRSAAQELPRLSFCENSPKAITSWR